MSAGARRLALLMIAVVALALRLWGIGFGAMQPLARPDEEIFALTGMGLFSHPYQGLGTGWPGGYAAVWHVVLKTERLFFGDANLACLLAVRPVSIYLPARAFSALLGAATVLPVYGLARAWRSESAGLFAAAAYAVNFLAVRDGHFAVTDATLCLLVACCLHACARDRLIAAGAFAGAAFGFKYAAVALAVPCAISAVLALRRGQPALRSVLLPTLAALVAFLIVTPSVLRDPGAFWSGLQSHGARYGGGALPFYAFTVLPAAFGWAGLLLSVAGLADRRSFPGVAFVIIILLLLLSPLRIPYARYASPLVPALAAGLGVALAAVLERRALAAFALAAIALGPPAVRAVQFDRLLAREDTRDLAARFLISQDKPVESRGGWAHVHALERGAQAACAAALPTHLRAPVPTLAGDSLPWRELIGRGMSGWEAAGRALIRPALDRLPAPEAELITESLTPPHFVNLAPAPALESACWPEQARFSPGEIGVRERYDAFFVPLDSLGDTVRPGPEVVIRSRACGNSGGQRTR
jgi:Dolichyl-phosphate-mannose-protein mannosyltransferase